MKVVEDFIPQETKVRVSSTLKLPFQSLDAVIAHRARIASRHLKAHETVNK
jgi:hypothetical protein